MAFVSPDSVLLFLGVLLSLVAIVATFSLSKYIRPESSVSTTTATPEFEPQTEIESETSNTVTTTTTTTTTITKTMSQTSPPLNPLLQPPTTTPIVAQSLFDTASDVSQSLFDAAPLNFEGVPSYGQLGSVGGAYRSCDSSDSTPFSGGLFSDAPMHAMANDPMAAYNEKLTIMRHKTSETTISFPGSKEPITIKQTTAEHIDIPALWNPFTQGLRFGVAEDQGKRAHMENSTNIFEPNSNATGSRRVSFSLFDGHLGDEAAKFCTENLHEEVDRLLSHCSDDENIEASIRQAFHATDAKWAQHALANRCEAGAVGVYVYYEAQDTDAPDASNCIYVANVGDCRAVLCSKGQAVPLTEDHNPKNEDEQRRCGDAIDPLSGLLSGQVSVTRAIGDFYAVEGTDTATDDGGLAGPYRHEKLKGLSCDPHIVKHELCADDEFVIIACDGLWDVMDNQNAMATCRRSLRRDGDVDKAAQKLIREAKARSALSALSSPSAGQECEEPLTADNISVMVIGFANRDKDGNTHIGPPMPRLGRSALASRRKRGLGGLRMPRQVRAMTQ